DGINDHIVHGSNTVNEKKTGTKAAVNYDIIVPAKQSVTLRLRLSTDVDNCFVDFDEIFNARKDEADQFYADLQQGNNDADRKLIQRQAFAGMLWSKQFYYYDVHQWLLGDPAGPVPPPERLNG